MTPTRCTRKPRRKKPRRVGDARKENGPADAHHPRGRKPSHLREDEPQRQDQAVLECIAVRADGEVQGAVSTVTQGRRGLQNGCA
jgi:hypothetical protein